MSFSRAVAILALVCLPAISAAGGAYAQAKGPAPAKQPPKEEKTFPKDSTWTLRAMNGKPVSPGMEATLKIDGQFRGSGFAGCNTWSATMWPVRAQHFAVGPMAVTKKQCAAPLMAFERSYLSALHTQPVWDVVNGMLEVKSPAGTLSFVRGF